LEAVIELVQMRGPSLLWHFEIANKSILKKRLCGSGSHGARGPIEFGMR